MLDPPFVHHCDAVAHHERLVLIVRDEDRRDSKFTQQMAQLDLHGLAQLAVERAERLVEQQQRRLDDYGARDRDALLLSAGEREHAAIREAFHAHQRERLADALLDLGLRDALRLEAEGHVFGDRQMRKQRVVLEHDADIAPVRGDARQVTPADRDRPEFGNEQPRDQAQQRGLSAA